MVDGGPDLSQIEWAVVEIGRQDGGDLGLGLGLQQPRRTGLAASADLHVVEECPEVGLTHPELLLHRLRGQADLAADDVVPGRAAPGPQLAL